MDLVVSSIPALLGGLAVTIQLMCCALAAGMLIAVPAAVLWVEAPKPVRLTVNFYVTFFRGTPLLVQVFLIYYGLGQFDAVRASIFWPLFRQPFFCAVLALSLNTSAYTANIIRGAIKSVPYGEIEAGRAFGMNRYKLYHHIIMPQAFRLFLPAYGNEVIIMLKATSLASTVTIMDLTGVAYNIVSNTYRPFTVFVAASVIYILVTFILTRLFRILEVRMNKQITEW